jgi:hypothetical protein
VLPQTGPFAGARQVEWDARRVGEQLGIALNNSGDGLMEPCQITGSKCYRTKQSPHGGKYAYFDLVDSYLFDEEDVRLQVEIEYFDRDFGSFTLQFDGCDPAASEREGAFQSLAPSVTCGDTGEWKTVELEIVGGRFANRCNGGDFRLAVTGGDLAIRRVTTER